MNILVTGASGFVGNYLVECLLARGHSVVAVSRDADKARRCSWYGRARYLSRNIHADGRALFDEADRPDALIHAAWDKLDEYRDPSHFEAAAAEHYRFIRDLIDAGLGQCLVLGTCLEYGLQEGALHEGLEARPVLAYPLGKHLLHEMLRGLQMHRSFSLQWVRLFYLYGPGQRSTSLLGQLEAALSAGRAVFDMSMGDQVRDYLPVTDVARIVCAIAERWHFDGVVNCCSGKPITVRALVERHLRDWHSSITLNLGKYPYPSYEPREFWGDRTRLDQLLGERR
ncbi:MAG: hypothetical protein RLZZ227_313 [Pseudomonadota bacterium]|jgi:dTDP-6-deoxy-L-talose 4-dehydrogenase (NAD+)